MSNQNIKSVVFSAEEVNLALAGLKSQHRILLGKDINDLSEDEIDFVMFQAAEDGLSHPETYLYESPLGKVGDNLIVREEHRPIAWRWEDGEVLIEYRDGSKDWLNYLTDEEFEENPNDDYLMDIIQELEDRKVPIISKDGQTIYDLINTDNLPHWRSADVMPDFASRLTIEITDVWAQYVQQISGDHAYIEGYPYPPVEAHHEANRHLAKRNAIAYFAEKWNKNNPNSAFWENPSVAVIEFLKASGEI